MRFSNSEVGALIQRACRGAGLPWGLADDAARSARWLHHARQPVLDWFNSYLGEGLATAPLTFRFWATAIGNADAPMPTTPSTTPTQIPPTNSTSLCPLRCGALLLDQRDIADGWLRTGLTGSATLTLPTLAAPALLLPALGRAIAATGKPRQLAVDWPGHRVIVTATRLHWLISSDPLSAAAPTISLSAIDADHLQPTASGGSAAKTVTVLDAADDDRTVDTDMPNPSAVHGLERLAHATTVPASDQSRAGAGETPS